MQENRIFGFDPIINHTSKILILGSLPGKVSLEQQMYYADKGNYFWKFMSAFFEKEYPDNNEKKVSMLLDANIALWDVYKSGVRVNKDKKRTSNDSDIIDFELNDIEGMLKQFSQIERIGISGKTAYKSFVDFFPNINAICLPSTSGSNGGQWGNKRIAEAIDINKKGWIEWEKFIKG